MKLSKKIAYLFTGLISILVFSYVGLILVIGLPILIYILWAITFPATPNLKEAKELLAEMSYPDIYSSSSFNLIYSKHYKDLLSSNVCFVFSYPEGYYDISQARHNYLNQNQNHENKNFIYDFDKNMVKNEGCSKFISKLDKSHAKLFMEYDYRHKPVGSGRGVKIFVNDKDNLVMFEGFLYD